MKPQVEIDLLIEFGAFFKEYEIGETIFCEDDLARFYYQIVEGGVKMININEDGKEYIQGYFCEGQSFGEPPLIIEEKYPATAVALKKTKIIKISKINFFSLLEQFPVIQSDFLKLLARRIYNKANTSKDIINQKPEFRIIAFLDTCKTRQEKEQIKYTRQEIANFTGLRVETVIRALSKMKQKKKVEIINHKIYY
ncbi:Crp/Fnr family transcriptional regulator [Flavobacterium sp. I3-2]|uniref:Crp/Fnr family transcriptional regulator n=1 Tax=Flavobacterium sp. I3-2 TaxID=2748319 RepID=UPI0015A9D083|nr:Crp/Fnr family transcriptional regulator [Flavobacterium sp. I3-2]